MATPPTLASDVSTAFDTSKPNTVSVTASSGNILVAVAVNNDWSNNSQNLSTPTGGPSWSLQYEHTTPEFACDIAAWTATASGSYTHSQTSVGAGVMVGGIVWVYSGSDGYDSDAGNWVDTEPPTISITTTTDNCAIVWAGGDYQASNDTTRSYTTINGAAGVEDVYFNDTGYMTVYAAHWADAGAAGAKTAGLATNVSNPATMETSQVAVAIKGTAGGATFIENATVINQASKRSAYW